MQYRTLGTTGLTVSAIGYGCGGIWGQKYFREADASKLLHCAIELGINFLDTGASYCGGFAEQRLGRILRELPRERLIVGSKCGTQIGHRGRLYKDYRPLAITANIDESLRRLGCDYLDLVLLHSISDEIHDCTIECLERLRRQGKVRFWGASCDGLALSELIRQYQPHVVMSTFNVLRRSNLDLLIAAWDRGIGVVVKSPMAHRIYTSKLWLPTSVADLWYLLRALRNDWTGLRRAGQFHFLSRVHDWTAPTLALAFVLQQEFVSCAIVGTTRLDNLVEDAKTTERYLPAHVQALLEQVG